MKWTGEERSSAVWSGWAAVRGRRDGFPGQGESRPDWAATETLSAASLPPKDSHPPPHPRAPRSCVSSLSSAAILSITFLSPPFVPPFPPAPFLHPPHSSSGPLQTLSSGLRAGGVGGCGGGMRRLRGTKALRCSGPTRVAGYEKKPGGVLMQQVDGQTRMDSPLSSSFS